MKREFEDDLTRGTVYFAQRSNEAGRERYLQALCEAIEHGDPAAIAGALAPVAEKYWILETRTVKGRKSTTPQTAAKTLAEGEFNRYYMRAVCHRAIEDGDGTVTVIRAMKVESPRADHLVKVKEGDRLDACDVLADLRLHPGTETEMGIPRGPNSGLTLGFESTK